MRAGELFLFLIYNSVLILGLHYWHKASMDRLLKRVRHEIRDLEDLVAAIIEEFEDTVEDKPQEENGETIAEEKPEIPVESSTLPLVPESQDSVDIISESEPVLPPDPKHQQILVLWQQGIPVSEIARRLGIGSGEVQLIIGLYRKS